MVYSKKTIYLSNKIIWYKFKIKQWKHTIQPKSAERKSYNF